MKPRHLQSDNLDVVLKALSLSRENPWALSCELLIRSGMRSHELYSVTTKDIDIERSTIFVHAAKKSNDRHVPIDKDCLQALAQSLQQKVMPWQNYLVESFKRSLREYWTKKRIELLGVGQCHCSLHGLRASFAVRLYQVVGKDLLLVQELLGHRNVTNTLAYLRLLQADERKPDILNAFKTTRRKKAV
jgi:integrase